MSQTDPNSPDFDIREYASVRGISRDEARAELGLDEDDADLPDTIVEQITASTPAGNLPGWGHNSGAKQEITSGDATALTMAARDKLRLIVARVNKLEEEKKEVAGQIKDVYAEAKSMGYDTKALRKVIRELNQDKQEREEQEAILDVYRDALSEYF